MNHYTLLNITDTLHNLMQWLKPEMIIREGGLWLLLVVIFAETGLFVGFFLPGDSLLFVSGLAVSQSWLPHSIIFVILLAVIAAITGNFVGYYFGYTLGPKLFKREDSLIFKKKYLDMTQAFYNRHGMAALVLGRFLPIIRTFVPILAGAIRMSWSRFALYNLIGAILWVPIMILAGFWLGKIEWVSKNVEVIVILLIIITIIPVIRTVLKERSRAKAS